MTKSCGGEKISSEEGLVSVASGSTAAFDTKGSLAAGPEVGYEDPTFSSGFRPREE